MGKSVYTEFKNQEATTVAHKYVDDFFTHLN